MHYNALSVIEYLIFLITYTELWIAVKYPRIYYIKFFVPNTRW